MLGLGDQRIVGGFLTMTYFSYPLHPDLRSFTYPASNSVGTGAWCPESESDNSQLMWRLRRHGVI
jgi:hypothetical protein